MEKLNWGDECWFCFICSDAVCISTYTFYSVFRFPFLVFEIYRFGKRATTSNLENNEHVNQKFCRFYFAIMWNWAALPSPKNAVHNEIKMIKTVSDHIIVGLFLIWNFTRVCEGEKSNRNEVELKWIYSYFSISVAANNICTEYNTKTYISNATQIVWTNQFKRN